MNRPIITLLTDFGLVDGYVAQMKGVLLQRVPEATIVDLSHDVPPQNVPRAAALLDDVVDAFPPDAIHVVVVDPGVGTQRPILAVDTAAGRFVAPDNGVLSHVAERFPPRFVVECDIPRWWGERVSATFHGRDVIAPLAAHWALGVDPREFGTRRDDLGTRLADARPQPIAGGLRGRVLWADRFGNLVTTIRRPDLAASAGSPGEPDIAAASVVVVGEMIGPIRRTYGEVEAGETLALFGSRDRLEIAVNLGSAAERFGWTEATTLEVEIRFGSATLGERLP